MVVLSAIFSFYTVRLDLDLDPRRRLTLVERVALGQTMPPKVKRRESDTPPILHRACAVIVAVLAEASWLSGLPCSMQYPTPTRAFWSAALFTIPDSQNQHSTLLFFLIFFNLVIKNS